MGIGSHLLYNRTKEESEKDSDKLKTKKGKKLSISDIKNMTPEQYEKNCRNKGW